MFTDRQIYSQVSLHHPAGECSCLREFMHEGQHLAGDAEHTQLVQVGVSQDVLLLPQTLTAQLQHLGQGRANTQVAEEGRLAQGNEKRNATSW